MNSDTESSLASISAPSFPAPPTPENPAFFDRFGLRAGWSIAIFIPIFLLFLVSLSFSALAIAGKLERAAAQNAAQSQAAKHHQPPPDVLPLDAFMQEMLGFTATALASLALARIERRRMAVYGIARNRLFDVLPGALTGLAALSLLVAVLRYAHLLVFDTQALHGPSIAIFGIKWLAAFLFVGLFEEYLNRGFLQFTLTRGLFGLAERISPTHARTVAFWLAAFVMSILFGAGHLHNARENPMGIVMVFLAGILFSYALWRTGSLWWAIGFHCTWDWAQSFLYGVPDSGQISAGRLFLTHPTGNALLSGGIDGPEGSVLVIPTLLLVALVVRLTTRPGSQPTLEPDPLPAPIALGLQSMPPPHSPTP